MSDGGYQAMRRAMWVDAEISGFDVARLDRPPRRLSLDEKAVIVAECHRSDAPLAQVARRYRVSPSNLRRWVRKARDGGLPEPKQEAVSPPAFIPVVVDGLPSDEAVTIEAKGIVVRLPAQTSVYRIAAVASYLGHLS